MPKEGIMLKFHDGQYQFKVPFTLYADFKSILEPIKDSNNDSANSCESYAKKVNKHLPSGFCVYSKFAYGDVEDPLKVYRGKDCVEKFCDYIENEVTRLYDMFSEKKMKKLTESQRTEFKKADQCHICIKNFDEDDVKVRDHCHYTGEYRGHAHQKCNLKYKIPSCIPIVFHNLSGYDSHLFIRELGKKYKNNSYSSVIAENKDKVHFLQY